MIVLPRVTCADVPGSNKYLKNKADTIPKLRKSLRKLPIARMRILAILCLRRSTSTMEPFGGQEKTNRRHSARKKSVTRGRSIILNFRLSLRNEISGNRSCDFFL